MLTKFVLGSYAIYLHKRNTDDICYSLDRYEWFQLNLVDKVRLVRTVKSYDQMLHQSLTNIIRERCLSSGQIEELLRNENSTIKPVLEQEAIVSEHFSKEEFGKIPLLWIALLGCYQDSAELLVHSGVDVNELFGSHEPQVADEKWTVLHVLLQMDPSAENERLIRLVMDRGADLQARDTYERTVLHFATEHGRVRLTELFLEKGADVNVADKGGNTPLLQAAIRREVNELLPLLMKHGADVFAKDAEGNNVLHKLAWGYPGHTADLARVLIEKGVSLDDREDKSEFQPIHSAASNDNNELVKLFLDYGANVNARAVDGQFPLYVATAGEFYMVGPELLTTLLKGGADVNLRTIKGRTVLHNICGKKDEPIKESIEILLSAGADMLIEDQDGNTPLSRIDPSYLEYSEDSVMRLIIRELALKKVCQPTIELKDERIIKQCSGSGQWDYYRDCIVHVSRMKFTRFIGTCTFLDLLTKDRCQIAALMRNPNFEANFKLYDLSGFSMYAEYILRAFASAQTHYRSLLELGKSGALPRADDLLLFIGIFDLNIASRWLSILKSSSRSRSRFEILEQDFYISDRRK